MAPLCAVAQVVKVLPSFEICILKPVNESVPEHARFKIFIDPIGCVLCKSTCHHLSPATLLMKPLQVSNTPSLALVESYTYPDVMNAVDDVGQLAAPVPHDRAKFCNGPVHIIICGLLFSPQQSCTPVVPGSALNPTGHCVQVNSNPFENVSAGQFVHAADPLTFLYFPATQAVHVPPFAPANAALQVQAPLPELETGAFEFRGHVKQVDEAVAPTAAEYVDGPQSVHAALPALVLYFPATHNAHAPGSPVLPAGQSNVHAAKAVLPAGDTPPAPHEVQTLAPVAPVAPDHVPATQSTHPALPVTILYLPVTHAEHVPPFAPVKPALHKQAASAVLETGAFVFESQAKHVDKALAPTVAEYVAAPQSVHASLPALVLYFPATHVVHVPPFAPVNPALHVQAAISVLETGAFAFAGHAEHVANALAPTAVEYVAVPQSVHAALPALVLYLPATHPEHTPPSAPVKPALHKQAPSAVLETGAFAFESQAKHVDKALAPTAAE
jgi:hypothetical protein